MNSRALIYSLFRHKGKMAAVIVAALGCGGGWAATHPPVYRARASLLVDGRRGEAVPAAMALLKSGAVQSPAVERVGARLFPGLGGADRLDAFARGLSVSAQEPGLIQLSLEARDGQAAADALSALIEQARLGKARISAGVGDSGDRSLEDAAAAARDKLAAFRRATGVFDIGTERKALLTQRMDLEQQATAAEASAAASSDKLALLRRQLAETPATIQLDSEHERSRVVEEARSKLFQVQTKEQELLGKYLPSSPLVQAVRDEKEQIEHLISRYDAPWEAKVEDGTNPLHQRLQQELFQSEADLAAASAKAKALGRQMADIDRRLDGFAANEKDLTDLQQSVADADSRLAASRAGAPQSPVITRIAVVQAPQASARPVGIGPLAALALSLILGVVAAVATALLAQRWSNRFATPADVEGALGLPVLTSIPREG